MKELIKLLKTDKILRWSVVSTSILIILSLALDFLFYFSLPLVIPLFNQMPWGESRLGTRLEIFLPIIVAATFFLCNLILMIKLYDKTPLLSRMLCVTAFLIALLTFIFLIRTLLLIV